MLKHNLMKKYILILSLALLGFTTDSFATWTVSGSSSVCANATNTYTLTGNPSGTTIVYVQWYLNIGGSTTYPTPASISVTWYDLCSQTGSISVDWVEYQDNDDQDIHYDYPSAGKNITLNGLGEIIPSPSWNCTPYLCSTGNITYCIDPVCGATNYQWQIPAGWTSQTLLYGPNQTCITLTPNSTGGGIINVTAENTSSGCNLSKTRSCMVTRPLEQPVFNQGSSYYCLTTSSAQYCVAPVQNAVSYSWILPSGWTGTSNSPCITVNFNGVAQTAQICCRVGLICGGSTTGCMTVTTFASVPVAPTFTQGPSPVAVGGTVQWLASSVPDATSYEWSFSPASGLLLNPWGAMGLHCAIDGVTQGNYMVKIRAHNECGYSSYKSAPLVVDDSHCNPCRTENETRDDEEIIFPNPTFSIITIDFGKETNGLVQLYNAIGELAEQVQVNSVSFKLDMSNKPNGIYFITVIDQVGNKVTRKVAKM